jgi:AcrR family transcriptional regulator
VSPSNFYYHFASKEELALEVLERTFEASRSKFAPIFMNKSLGAAEKLERLHALFVERMEKSGCCGGCPMGNLATELSDSNPRAREKIAGFFEECIEGIESVVRQGMKAGEFRDDVDPRASADLLFGSLEGLMLLSKSLKSVEPLDRGFRQALSLMKKPSRNRSS